MRKHKNLGLMLLLLSLVLVSLIHLATVAANVPANTIHWMSRDWIPTNGGMAGVVKGDPANVSIDSNGYLHLRIVNRDGTYTAAEVFTTENLGFGTYQWQIEGAVDKMDKSTVLGLFNYGARGGVGLDAENEIDIEFSQWNDTCHGCNADFTFYPATGNKSLGPMEDNFTYNPNGSTLTTARFEWSSTRIVGTIMSGLQPMDTTANVLQTITFAPPDYTSRIPQVPIPLAINLWCFRTTPASDQQVIIRSFQFVPAAQSSKN
ncbi:MAG: glycoside hydrolase family 16 protein [Candidatus Acidiferrum sp.]